MSREIKFRAWDKNEQTMLRPPVGFQQLLRQVSNRNDNSIGGDAIRRHELEWMQYTGLKDKNGVEIYEGDVCEGHYGRQDAESDDAVFVGAVRFSWGGFEIGFPVRTVKFPEINGDACSNWTDYYPGGTARSYYRISDITVIGNIYENPELLEAK